MKTKFAILSLFALVIFAACGKDKFTTIPQIKMKSISPDQAVRGSVVRIVGEYTDQEGDLDSVFVVYKWFAGATATYVSDTFKTDISNFPLPKNTKKADLVLEYSYGLQIDGVAPLAPTPSIRDTTAAFGIRLKDKAGNLSEYQETGKIRLTKL